MIIAVIITTLAIFVLLRLARVGFILDLISYKTQEIIEQILSIVIAVLIIGLLVLTVFAKIKFLLAM